MSARLLAANDLASAVWDEHAPPPGAVRVMTHRVIDAWFDATPDEQAALMALVREARSALARRGAARCQVVFEEGAGAAVLVTPCPPDERAEPLATGAPDRDLRALSAPLFRRAERVDVVAAFVRRSGLHLLLPRITDVLDRGGEVRIVTGDYLEITEAEALQSLLDLQELSRARAPDPEATTDADADADAARRGTLEARVVESSASGRSFHPKAWIFLWDVEGHRDGVAWVGSSNVSRSALTGGVEWNLRLERRRDAFAFDRVAAAFDALWLEARPLDAAWIEGYRARRAVNPAEQADEATVEEAPPAPTPLPGPQADALVALARARQEGARRGLVVLATGLGKTFLAAFDLVAFERELGRPARLLVLAHRQELLEQAQATLRRLLPERRASFVAGALDDLSGALVFASIQKLSRSSRLEALEAERFDYVVVDEVHHAAAPTWRRVLGRLAPGFMLGLTATPDRTDAADLLGLFDDRLIYRADLADGVRSGHLVPFHYEGLRDTIDYAPIPWRNRRFDPAALAAAAQTQERMAALWAGWERLPGTRTLVFCASIEHARFVSGWLGARGVRVAVVHSGPDSDDRAQALAALERGALDALCAVDLFNEGIDCRPIDRVVMLRPTGSPVVFFQQLGRGLRTSPGKERLQVIDFVGNHRVFLERLRALLSLSADAAGGAPDVRGFVQGQAVEAALPAGCSVRVELEAKALLARLLSASSSSALVAAYRELRDVRGVRPQAGELLRRDHNPSSLLKAGGWFRFVADEGDLTDAERGALESAPGWFDRLERAPSADAPTFMVLDALLDADALLTGLPLAAVSARVLDRLQRDPALLDEGTAPPWELEAPEPELWEGWWREALLAPWLAPRQGRAALAVEGGVLRWALPIPAAALVREALAELTRELVDLQLARRRRRVQDAATLDAAGQVSAFTMKVLTNASEAPILVFGNDLNTRSDRERLPTGDVDVRLPDGGVWGFRFVKIACNVARPVGASRNQLADLLRGWFGPSAGQRGTQHRVRFFQTAGCWWVEPLGATLEAPESGWLPAFPTLRAAAGALAAAEPLGEGVEFVGSRPVRLPTARRGAGCFAVRASGDSMAGGAAPIRDGDWVVLEWARGLAPGAVEGRVALVAVLAAGAEPRFLLKRVCQEEGEEGGWVLRSDNPDEARHPELRAPQGAEVVAVVREIIGLEGLGPAVGAAMEAGGIAGAFGLEAAPSGAVSRVEGHLFLCVETGGVLVAPDRLDVTVPERAPGEAAFVLTRSGGADLWRYGGLGRWSDGEGLWVIPAVDFATWRALGTGRGASRRLEARWEEEARRVAVELAGCAGRWCVARGERCRIAGASARGGVRVDGGPGGFGERTVSLLDLGWVLEARAAAEAAGSVVDEGFVNRRRYLEGTPRGSTRFIDTGWALVLTEPSRVVESA